ncbi:MAG TPA: hypothetical protein VF228_13315, partial [Iamia sp.]
SATLIGRSNVGRSIDGDNLVTGGPFFVVGPGAYLGGGVRLNGAAIGGQFAIEAAVVDADGDGLSIDADHIKIASAVFLTGSSTVLVGGINFSDASIEGRMNISNGVSIGLDAMERSLWFDGTSAAGLRIVGRRTSLAGGVHLYRAALSNELSITGATIGPDPDGCAVDGRGLFATGVAVDGDAALRGSLSLASSEIPGEVAIRACTIGSDDFKRSVGGDAMKIEGSVRLSGCELHGVVGFSGSKIRGNIELSGAAFILVDPDGVALWLNDAAIGGSLYLTDENVSLSGSINLSRAQLTGQFVLANRVAIGAREDGTSIQGEALSAHGVIIRDARLAGSVALPVVTLVYGMIVEGASEIHADRSEAAITVAGSTIPRLRLRSTGVSGLIDLSDSVISRLDDTTTFWGLPSGRLSWLLDGCTISRLSHEDDFPLSDRHLWLAKNYRSGSEITSPADRATYRMVASAYVNEGEEDKGLATLVEMRKRHNPPWMRRALWPIGQGYHPQRALLALLLVFIAVFSLTVWAHLNGEMIATGGLSPAETFDDVPNRDLIRSEDCDSEEYPCLRPLVYSADVMVPGLDLGEAARWSPRTGRGTWEQASIVRALLSALRIAGWAFGALFLIGAANLVVEQRRRQDA